MNWNEQKKHYMKILETIENDPSIREIVAPALCCAPEKQCWSICPTSTAHIRR